MATPTVRAAVVKGVFARFPSQILKVFTPKTKNASTLVFKGAFRRS